MLGRTLALAVALATSGALPPGSKGQPDAFDSPAASARAESLRVDVAAELLEDPPQAWAGSYYWGDGLGANVSLDVAPSAGFVFEWHGCLGLYGRNYGSVSESGGRVRLEPELPNRAGAFAATDVEFVPVSWGPRRYLIAADKLAEFCNAVNGGQEPRALMHGLFLLRRGDEAKPADGRPVTPEGTIGCLLQHPIQARIVSVAPPRTHTGRGDVEWKSITVVVDAGREQGVWEGMEFHPLPPGRTYGTARVTRVFERASEAVFDTYADDDLQPRPGWPLSTRPD